MNEKRPECVFVAWDSSLAEVRQLLEAAVDQVFEGSRLIHLGLERPVGELGARLKDALQRADRGIAFIDRPNVNVTWELGWLLGAPGVSTTAVTAGERSPWVRETLLQAMLVEERVATLEVLTDLNRNSKHWRPSSGPPERGEHTGVLLPATPHGDAVAGALQRRFPEWRILQAPPAIDDIGPALAGLCRLAWVLLPISPGSEPPHGVGNAVAGIVAGAAASWDLPLRVFRFEGAPEPLDLSPYGLANSASATQGELENALAIWSQCSDTAQVDNKLARVILNAEGVYDRVGTNQFVGREWLFEELKSFIGRHQSGYFVLEAPAGLGKTAWVAAAARRYNWPVHFIELAPGAGGDQAARASLAAQLLQRRAVRVDPSLVDECIGAERGRIDVFERVLRAAARAADEPVVILVDGLDETLDPGSGNPLDLPAHLPEGVFVVVSRRPGGSLVGGGRKVVRTLQAGDPRNVEDMRRFLTHAARDSQIAARLREPGDGNSIPEDAFVNTLIDRCAGVWVYLQYVLQEVRSGERRPLRLEALPKGLDDYYAELIERWRRLAPERWSDTHLVLLATATTVREAIPLGQLCRLAGGIPEPKARRLLDGPWRAVFSCTGPGRHYRPYHQSFSDLFLGRWNAQGASREALRDELHQARIEAHRRIANAYLDAWGGLDHGLPALEDHAALDDGYGLRNVPWHLVALSAIDDVHALITLCDQAGNRWLRVHRDTGLISAWFAMCRAWARGFLDPRVEEREPLGQIMNMLVRGSQLLESEVGRAVVATHAVVLSALERDRLAAALEPDALVASVRSGERTTEEALAEAREVPDFHSMGTLVARIATLEQGKARADLEDEAIEIARRQVDLRRRLRTLASIHPDLTGPRSDRAAASLVHYADLVHLWRLAHWIEVAGDLESKGASLVEIYLRRLEHETPGIPHLRSVLPCSSPNQRARLLDAFERTLNRLDTPPDMGAVFLHRAWALLTPAERERLRPLLPDDWKPPSADSEPAEGPAAFLAGSIDFSRKAAACGLAAALAPAQRRALFDQLNAQLIDPELGTVDEDRVAAMGALLRVMAPEGRALGAALIERVRRETGLAYGAGATVLVTFAPDSGAATTEALRLLLGHDVDLFGVVCDWFIEHLHALDANSGDEVTQVVAQYAGNDRTRLAWLVREHLVPAKRTELMGQLNGSLRDLLLLCDQGPTESLFDRILTAEDLSSDDALIALAAFHEVATDSGLQRRAAHRAASIATDLGADPLAVAAMATIARDSASEVRRARWELCWRIALDDVRRPGLAWIDGLLQSSVYEGHDRPAYLALMSVLAERDMETALHALANLGRLIGRVGGRSVQEAWVDALKLDAATSDPGKG